MQDKNPNQEFIYETDNLNNLEYMLANATKLYFYTIHRSGIFSSNPLYLIQDSYPSFDDGKEDNQDPEFQHICSITGSKSATTNFKQCQEYSNLAKLVNHVMEMTAGTGLASSAENNDPNLKTAYRLSQENLPNGHIALAVSLYKLDYQQEK